MSDLFSIIINPIQGDNPFGIDIHHDTDFDVVRYEIAKKGALDHQVIEEVSRKIISEKSKDIRVLFFLSFSYLLTGKWEEFSAIYDGLGVLAEDNYDALFPQRNHAKEMAFRWLAEERFSSVLDKVKPPKTNQCYISRMVKGLTKIKDILEVKFPERSPFPSVFLNKVKQWELLGESALIEQNSITPGAVLTETPGEQSPIFAAETTLESRGDNSDRIPFGASSVETSSMSIRDTIRKAALLLVQKERTNPCGYRIARSLMWDDINKAPPDEDGRIRIEGVTPQQQSCMKNLFENREWKGILEKGETLFLNGVCHFWIDLQRFLVSSCEALGGEFHVVGRAIMAETTRFIQRVPELIGLSYSDGTPFCDHATKEWVNSTILSTNYNDSSEKIPEVTGGVSSDKITEEIHVVNGLITTSHFDEALALLKERANSSSNERDNFIRSTTAGRVLLKANQIDIAVALLESLCRSIDLYSLEKWDPIIVLEARASLASAYTLAALGKPQDIQAVIHEKRAGVLGKIGIADPVRAAALCK